LKLGGMMSVIERAVDSEGGGFRILKSPSDEALRDPRHPQSYTFEGDITVELIHIWRS